MKAIVVGGGIGGMAAALALRNYCDVEVYEKVAENREVGAGISLWSNALVALQYLQAADEVLKVSSQPMVDGFVRNSLGEELGEVSTKKIVTRTGMPTVAVHRAELVAALERAFCRPVHTYHRCVAVQQTDDCVTVQFENGKTVTGDLLVGADGIHSVVRQHLHGQQPTRYAGYFAWRGVADFDYPEYRPGSWQMSLGRGSQFGYMPLTNGRVYWFGTKNSSSRRVDKVNAKQAALDFFASWHAPVRDVISATADVLCNPIIDRPPLKSWGKGRITLLGDAAHATTPNLGQGACQAMEDAVVLAQALSVQRDISSALRMYEQARIPRTSGVINESYRIGQVLQLENDFVRRMRDRLLRLTLGTWLDTGMKYADFKVGTVAC